METEKFIKELRKTIRQFKKDVSDFGHIEGDIDICFYDSAGGSFFTLTAEYTTYNNEDIYEAARDYELTNDDGHYIYPLYFHMD